MGQLFQISLAEAAGGAAAGIVADSVLYAIDSAKVRAQAAATTPVAAVTTATTTGAATATATAAIPKVATRTTANVSILFRGLAPSIFLGSVPVFGSFFLLYAPVRETLHSNGYTHLLPLASAICAIPATVIGVPADVLKKRLVLGIDPNFRSAVMHILSQQGWKGLFAGWHVNLIRDLPFAGVKMGLYEYFVLSYRRWYHPFMNRYYHHLHNGDTTSATRSFMNNNRLGGTAGTRIMMLNNNEYQYYTGKIPTSAAAICGVASGVCCAFLTCPLDVVNTRIKAGETIRGSSSIMNVTTEIIKTEGMTALFRGVFMRSIVLGIGSSIFWPIQHSVAHSLQPYEYCPVINHT